VEEEENMKRVGSLMSVFIFVVVVAGMSVHAQQQNPSSQQMSDQEKKTSEQETTTTTTTTNTDASTQQESQDDSSAGTASTLQGVMLSSDTIIGATVKNEENQEVGKIERLHISPKYGVVMYAELSVGDFLGTGEKTIMVPWKTIEIARSGDSLVVNTPKDLLKKSAN
jgi:sporulation protein YlmC with PRC-barrel domain